MRGVKINFTIFRVLQGTGVVQCKDRKEGREASGEGGMKGARKGRREGGRKVWQLNNTTVHK